MCPCQHAATGKRRLQGAGSVAGGMAAGDAGGSEAGRPSPHGGAWPAERGDRGERGDRVWVREYEDGRLLREDELSAEELEAAFGPLSQRASRHTRRRRRVREPPYSRSEAQRAGAGAFKFLESARHSYITSTSGDWSALCGGSWCTRTLRLFDKPSLHMHPYSCAGLQKATGVEAPPSSFKVWVACLTECRVAS